MFIQKSWRLST